MTTSDILNPKMEDGFLLDWSAKSPIIINNTGAASILHLSKLVSICPLKLSGKLFFPFAFIFYPQNCHHTAGAFPSPSPSLLTAPSPLLFCFSLPWKHTRQVWQEMRQMVRMTGGTFLEGEMKGNMRRSHTDTLFPLFETLYLLDRQQACKIQTCLCKDTNVHTHTQCICPL